MAPKITLHHLNASRSTRIFWALEELGLDYDVKVWYRTASGRAPVGLKDIHTLSSAPVVEVDAEVFHESSYIITRLLELAPTIVTGVEIKPSWDSQYWCAFAEGTLMVWMQAGGIIGISAAVYAEAALSSEDNEKGKQALLSYQQWAQNAMVSPESQTHIDYEEARERIRAQGAESSASLWRGLPGLMDQYLSDHAYFSGTDQPGLADFMFILPLMVIIPPAIKQGTGASETALGKLMVGEGLRSWWKRIEARPALQRALRRQQDEEEGGRS